MAPGRTYVLPREALDVDNLFHARVSTTCGIVERVLCALKLPGIASEKITISFYPTVRQIHALQFARSFEVSGKYKVSGVAYTIHATEVWGTGISSGSKDGISFYSTFQGSPSELNITTSLGIKRGKHLSRGTFRLTDCPVINAASIIGRSYTGNVRVRRVVIPTFRLRTGVQMMFKYHFDSADKADGETTTTSHLAAEFKALKRIPSSAFAEVKRDLDDFLLLASFASRYRCICPSWSYSDDGSSHVEHFYQNIAMPNGHIPSLNETLIDVQFFPKFIRKAYGFYSRNSQTDLLDNAIFALVNEHASLEDRFTRVFTGLQSLLWFVYRNEGRTKDRVPIKELFKAFSARYDVKFDDLWPLFDKALGPSLYDIRNSIAHGEFLDPRKSIVVSCAQENLNWTVERMLLTILEWPIERSKVTSEFLRGLSKAHDWAAFRSQW